MTTLETVLLRRNWGYFTKSCESGARAWPFTAKPALRIAAGVNLTFAIGPIQGP
jgi:hypothetical protein